MLKKLFLVSLLMIVTNVFCQKKSGEVCYKVQAVKFELNANDSKINDFTKKIWTISDEQSFTLRFNALKSSFILSQVLKNDDVGEKSRTLNRIASMLVSTPYSYFFDLNEKNYLLKTDEGILIDKPREKLIWEITNESKTIGDYLCYKATCIKSFTGRDGKEKHTPVTAWFAPSLPYSFGPKEYNGLPGLILEIVENKSIFYASSILIYDGKDREVEFPKGKTITEDDYTKKVMSN